MKIAVCDDEPIMRRDVCQRIRTLLPECIVDSYEDARSLLRSKQHYDLYFLDVDMPLLNGMEAAEKIYAAQKNSLIIFLTAHAEYMPDAFKVRAFRFLCKPLEQERFAEALFSAKKEITRQITITIQGEHGVVSIPLQDLVCLEAYGDGVYLYTADAVYNSTQTLRAWMEKLESCGFYRVHRSYAVSLRHVLSIRSDDHVVLRGVDLDITVSRRNKKGLKEAFMAYVIEQAGVSAL